ncbi:MAG: CHRD domain-containing protein [Betaproteobacteria bacterium]|nr:CHRD domain-containing protein [Betaproteobacteria bacterium]
MKYRFSLDKLTLGMVLVLASASASAQLMQVVLSGAQEVPPVSTQASANGTISVGADLSISGSVSTTGVEGTMAHIHKAPAGQNGPVVVPMVKTADNIWSIPAGAKLTEAQFQDLKDGNLYINVHSAAHKGGEVRGQLKP